MASKIQNDYEETKYLLDHFKHDQLAVLTWTCSTYQVSVCTMYNKTTTNITFTEKYNYGKK